MKERNEVNLLKSFHQNLMETEEMMDAVQISFTSVDGQANNSIEFINEHEAVKPYQIQRFTKERSRGLRARDFLACHFDIFETAEEKQTTSPYEDTSLISMLYKQSAYFIYDDLEEVCIIPETYDETLSWCITTISTSPTGRLLVKEAIQHGWQIGIGELGGPDFHLDVPNKTIILDDHGLNAKSLGRSGYFRNVLRISLIRALRDVWQEIRHGGFDEEYDAQSILMLERVRAADADVMSILVSWELRGEGQPELWRYMIGSEEGDIAMAFSNYLEKNPSAHFNCKALIVAFKQWYLDEARVNACDHETLEYMDAILQEYPVGNPFGKRRPTHIGIEILSCLPDKTAYLRGQGEELLKDPRYGGMNDEINQSHFMQIMHDVKVTYVEGVPFTDMHLAEKIFPNGEFTPEPENLHETS